MNPVSEVTRLVPEPTPDLYRQAGRLRLWFDATRPAFLSASLLPVLVGLALAWQQTGRLDWLLALLTLVGVALIHGGANVLNDYWDARNGTDQVNRERIYPFSGGSRFIQNRVMGLEQTLWLGLVLLGLGLVCGLWVTWLAGPVILLIGVAGGLLAVFYSAPPCLACRGLGDGVIALCFGVLPVTGTVWTQLGNIPPAAFWLGLVAGLQAAAILWVNSIPDISADRVAGKLTLPARLGHRRAPWGLALLLAASGAVLVLAPLPAGCRLALPGLALGVAALVSLWRGRLVPAIVLTLACHGAVTLLLAVGCLL